MRIAVAQILSGTDPADNLQLVRDYTGRAAESGASLVVFPEATMCRFGVPLAPIAEPVDGPWADGVRRIAADAGADFVKTSTGFHRSGGASPHAVALMAATVGAALGVKASGGIRTTADAVAMLDAGATRLGLSGTRAVLAGLG